MKKKATAAIVGIIVVALGIGALWYVAPNLYETEEPETVNTSEDEFLYECMMGDGGDTDMDAFIETFENTDSEYIWLDIDVDAWTWKVYSVSKESLESKIADLGSLERGMRVSDINTVKKSAETIISNFGTKKEKVKITQYLAYAGGINLYCFDNRYYDGKEGERFNLAPYLNDEGLVLSHENVAVKRVMTSNTPFYSGDNPYIVEIVSDVTCEENSGAYKDFEWIPDEGQTETITFVVECTVHEGGKTEIFAYNIGIK